MLKIKNNMFIIKLIKYRCNTSPKHITPNHLCKTNKNLDLLIQSIQTIDHKLFKIDLLIPYDKGSLISV